MALGWFLLALSVLALGYVVFHTGDNQNRVEALKRITWGIPFLVVMFFAGTVFGLYIVLSFALDVAWQLVTGRDGFASEGHAERLWVWKDRNTRWVAYGDGSPKLIP